MISAEQLMRRKLLTLTFRLSYGLVLLFAVVQVYLLSRAQALAAEEVYLWLKINRPQIAEAVFLENVHSVSGLVERALRESADASLKIDVQDSRGHFIYGGSDSSILSLPIGRYLDRLNGDFSVVESLSFSNRDIGKVFVRGNVKPTGWFYPSLFVFLLLFFLFLIYRQSLYSFSITMEKEVLLPLKLLENQMKTKSHLEIESLPMTPQNSTVAEIQSLVTEYNSLIDRVIRNESEIKKLASEAGSAQIAKQVAHDIRSPLSALNLVVSTLSDLPEEKRVLIRNVANRINDIANNLMSQQRQVKAKNNLQTNGTSSNLNVDRIMLVTAIDSVLSEKRSEYRNRNIVFHFSYEGTYGLFAKISQSKFMRCLSNLINNSVESIDSEGTVECMLWGQGDTVFIEVKDSGRGIPQDVLHLVGQKGFSFGKDSDQSGSGLGFSYVKDVIAEAGGKVEIISDPGSGTSVRISLPKTAAPIWFIDKLEIDPNLTLVSMDDDRAVHDVWNNRFLSELIGHEIKIKNFTVLKDFVNWYNESPKVNTDYQFLVDYELLGEKQTGLDLIDQLGIAKSAILVTSRYDEPHVVQRALNLGIKIIPKGLSAFVPIVFKKQNPNSKMVQMKHKMLET